MENRKKIKALSAIRVEMEKYFRNQKHRTDSDYRARMGHYITLAGHLDSHEYGLLKDHIESGLNKFRKNFSITARYYNFLEELKLNLTPENDNDQLERIQRLARAIYTNEKEKIAKALDEGCIAVIDTPYMPDPSNNTGIEEGALPLNYAINKGSMNFLDSLHEKKIKSYLSYLNEPDDNGKTKLFLACESNQTKEAKVLLEHGADPNIKNKEGISCLELAVRNNNFELVSLLLKNENVKINFDIFYYSRAQQHAQPEIFKLLYDHFKVPVKKHKKDIMNASACNDALFKQQPFSFSSVESVEQNPISSIASQLYTKNHNLKKVVLIELSNAYKCPLLQPLLTIVGLGSAGVRNKHRPSKPLKTIIDMDNKHVTHLVMGVNERTFGAYTSKSSAYVGFQGDQSYAVGTMLHEWKHFADREMFDSSKMIFTTEDQKKYDSVREEVRQNIENFPTSTQGDKYVKGSFDVVFSYHKPDEIDYELLARVPQVLGDLGIEKGIEWLNTNTPSLLNFYKNTYNNYLTAHIEKMRNEYSQVKDSEVVNTSYRKIGS
jgi:hypothetical protein